MVAALIAWQQFILPFGAIAVGRALGLDPEIVLFIVVTLTSGSLFASPTLVQLMGLDQRIAVQAVVLSTLAAPFSIFLFFSFLFAGPVDLDLAKFAERLFFFLALPLGVLALVRHFIRHWSETKKDRLDRVGRWGAVISLAAFCFALEHQVRLHIAEELDKIFYFLFIALATASVVAISTRLVLGYFGGRAAATGALLATFRNVGLTFGLVGAFAGPDVALYVGVSQIPMFCAPY